MNNHREPVDIDARRRVLDPRQSFIVQAPAGSGKTELLTQRFLRLLATVDAPEEIIAITFTRKAAGEMRNRILAALDAASRAEAPEDAHKQATFALARAAYERNRNLGWHLEMHPARLRIQTIDSLNAMLTRQMPILSNFGSQPAIMDAPEETYQEAAERTLDLLNSDVEWGRWIASLLSHLDNNIPRARDLLVTMLRRRDQWLRHVAGASGQVERGRLEAALEREVSHQLLRLRDSVPQVHESEIVALAKFASGNVKNKNPDSKICYCAGLGGLPGVGEEDVAAWQGMAELYLTGTGAWRKRPNVQQGFPPEQKEYKTRVEQLLLALHDADEFRRLLHAVRNLPPVVYAEAQWEIVETLTRLLPLAVAQLQLVFAERGEVDYAEIALRALQALGSTDEPTDLALALDYRIRHILVDEFQDTSANQYELLQRLTAGWEPGDGRTLFIVGDPMQSIYRFREAEVGLFLRARHEGIGNTILEPVTLSVDFRSE
ncbi:MAG: UvrD-helicase domain-containing protein, partial [Gammaproteobacteria bacterium]|nr:UvrD-helicase domain-containing protein [Gammaproteobacteria bacterium]